MNLVIHYVDEKKSEERGAKSDKTEEESSSPFALRSSLFMGVGYEIKD